MIDSTCAESSWWRRAASVVVVLVLLGAAVVALPGAAPTAAARDCGGGLSDAAAGVGCHVEEPGATPTPTARPRDGEGGASAPRVRHRFLLACEGGALPIAGAEGCAAIVAPCAPPSRLYRGSWSVDGVIWMPDGPRCLTEEERQRLEAVPGLTLADFRRLPIPGQAVVLEPGNGYALVGVPLNAVAGTAPQLLQTTILGAPVSVRATPVAWSWDFGDGTQLGPTSDPGALFPALGTTHTYQRGGDVQVVLTTTYAGEFSVDGGAFTPVGGTAQVASPPVPLAVLVGGGALVGDPVG